MELKIEAEVIKRTLSYPGSGRDRNLDRTVVITVGGQKAYEFTQYVSSSDEEAISLAVWNWIGDHLGTKEE